ncbi:MAG: multicopper oxidase family protein [Polyangiaceae bacterium]
MGRELAWMIPLSVVTLALTTCAADAPPPYEEPQGWSDDVALARVVDLNPDPHVLEIHLVAKEADLEMKKGKTTHVYTFDGSIPGPLIEATAGDRVIVHFENRLPEPTTLHWHGVRVPRAMDGAARPEEAVPPGGTFDYDFVVPDAGLFWYHPHFDASKQVGYGLYGALLVRPADDSEANLPKDEVVLVLSDMGILDDGSIMPADAGGDVGSLIGREGNVVLANGRRLPRLTIRSGVTQRWRIVNAARARYFQLELGHTRFLKIGGDGGLLEHPIETDNLLVAPGQRADVLVTPVDEAEGLEFLISKPYDRGFGSATQLRFPEEILALDYLDEPGPRLVPRRYPDVHRAIEPLDTTGATTVHMALTQTKEGQQKLELGVNDVPFDASVPFPARVGDTQIWELENTLQWAHPIHLHGFFFQELDAAGQPVDPIEWRDTIDVPVFETRRFAVKFDDRPGQWMFHCQVLDHADAGMMGIVDVQP